VQWLIDPESDNATIFNIPRFPHHGPTGSRGADQWRAGEPSVILDATSSSGAGFAT